MRRLMFAGLLVVAAGCGEVVPSTSQTVAEQTVIDKYGGEKLPTCAHSAIAAGSDVRVTELPNLGLALVFVDDKPFCLDSIHEVEGVLSITNSQGAGGGTLGNSAAASGGVDPMPARTSSPRSESLDPGHPL